MLPVLFLVTSRDGTVYQEHAQGSETVRTRWSAIGLCTLGKMGSYLLLSMILSSEIIIDVSMIIIIDKTWIVIDASMIIFELVLSAASTIPNLTS